MAAAANYATTFRMIELRVLLLLLLLFVCVMIKHAKLVNNETTTVDQIIFFYCVLFKRDICSLSIILLLAVVGIIVDWLMFTGQPLKGIYYY